MTLTKIEQIAAVLLKNKVSFNYDGKYVVVNDSDICFNLFESASYHIENKKLVLMSGLHKGYTQVSFEDFKTYFNIK